MRVKFRNAYRQQIKIMKYHACIYRGGGEKDSTKISLHV